MTRAGGAGSLAAAMVWMVAACSKSDEPRPVASTSPRIVLGSGVAVPAASVDPAPPVATALTPHHEPIEFNNAPLSYTVTEKREAGATPVVDPDQAIVQAARVSAGACFAGLSEGPDIRSATLQVSVVPSGQVSRTSVSAQAAEPEVLDCLRRVGNGLHFSSRDDSQGEGIRSFLIDVTVARPH